MVNSMGMKRMIQVTLMAAAAAALTACGSAASYNNTTVASYESAADTAAYDGGFYEEAEAVAEEIYNDGVEYEAGGGTQDGISVPEDALASRKLIKNVSMDVETEQFDTLMSGLEQRVLALGGYIEEMSSFNRNDTYSADYVGTRYLRYANMTVRMPKENLDSFLAEVGEQTNVVSRSESVTDVTLQYVDLESHKKALTTEQARLLELMGQAELVEDIIAIESRLSEVRYQLESMESQLRTYDNQIDYSTVYLSIDEVKRYSPAENAGIGERIRRGFVNSLWGIGQDAQECGIWVLVNLPYLVVWAVIIVVAFFALRLLRKIIGKRMAKRAAKRGGMHPVSGFLQRHNFGRYGDKDMQAADELPGADDTTGEDVKQ